MKDTYPKPPKLAQMLLKWRASNAEIADILGDMEEYFQYNVAEKGLRQAKRMYWKQTLSVCFSYALRKRKSHAAYSAYYSDGSVSMINNYVKIAVRNFVKHKLFTLINILGLALGMSICLLALSISMAIFQSDDFHEKKDRIFQINSQIEDANDNRIYGSTFPAVGEFLEAEYPFVKEALSIRSGFRPTIRHQGNLLDFHGYYTDPEFFDVFSFQLLQGDPQRALAEPNSIVLTKSVAEKLYRDTDPMGKVLDTNQGQMKVTGVMPDLKNTHLYFQVLTSTNHFRSDHSTGDWQQYRNNYLYILLKESTSQTSLNTALERTAAVAAEYNPHKTIDLQSIALTKAVPRWDISNAIGIGWDYPSMMFFMFIGLLILLPAIFNYTNLSIARALKRAKEIGVRKVVGAGKGQIKMQFIVETIVMCLIALLCSIFIFIPLQEELLKVIISAEVLDTSIKASLILLFVGFAILIGLISGLFPALYFSKLDPVSTLKGDLKQGMISISGIKKGLFVFQFALSLFFLIGVATIARQYSHVMSHNHGFDSRQVITIPFYDQNKEVAIHELSIHPDVKDLTTTSHLPGILFQNSTEATANGKDTLEVLEVFIGEGFIDQMKMKTIWGSPDPFDRSTKNEELVLVNEQFFKSMSVFGQSSDSLRFTLMNGQRLRVGGVIEDLHFEPLSEQISPMVFRYSIDQSHYALLTVQSADIRNTLSELEATWRGIDQSVPFQASFLDDEIAKAYRFLTVQIKIFSFLSALAIVISCLGLLGMVAYTTESRTKEIAIRKIMGASVAGIYLLLTRDFIKLIFIAALLAIPFSYIFYDQLFLYMLIRYGLGLGVLEVIGSVLFLFLVGFAFIYWQTSKVAQANPALNLRYE